MTDTMNTQEQLDLACEKFRKILEGQLTRVEDMKQQGAFTATITAMDPATVTDT